MSEPAVPINQQSGRRFVRAVKDFPSSEVRWRALRGKSVKDMQRIARRKRKGHAGHRGPNPVGRIILATITR
jgi:hypothetical protein